MLALTRRRSRDRTRDWLQVHLTVQTSPFQQVTNARLPHSSFIVLQGITKVSLPLPPTPLLGSPFDGYGIEFADDSGK